MPISPDLAAAGGLPTPRRAFLRQLAGLAIVAPAVAIPTQARVVPAVRVENPGLAALTRRLHRAMTVRKSAVAARDAALETFCRLKPEAPSILVGHGRDVHMPFERDYHGKILGKDVRSWRHLWNVESLEPIVARLDGRTVAGREARQCLRVARDYERAVAEAELTSDIEKASDALSSANYRVTRLAEAIIKAEARTMTGLEIKARALLVAEEVDGHIVGAWWARDLVHSIIALAGTKEG